MLTFANPCRVPAQQLPRVTQLLSRGAPPSVIYAGSFAVVMQAAGTTIRATNVGDQFRMDRAGSHGSRTATPNTLTLSGFSPTNHVQLGLSDPRA